MEPPVTPDSKPGEPGEPEWFVFDRSRPAGLLSRLPLFAIVALSLVLYDFLRDGALGGPLGTLQSSVGRLLFARSLVGVVGLGLIVLHGFHVGRSRRRFGRCELSRYRARFTLRWGDLVEIDQADVQGWTVTPFGLLVEVHGRGPFLRRLRPLLVPTTNEEEVRFVEALLRGEDAPFNLTPR